MPPFVLSCVTYLGVALPGSTLGMLWPSMRVSFHEPVGALGLVLVAGVAAAVVSSAATGRILSRIPAGPLLAAGSALVAGALAMETVAPALWLLVVGSAVFSTGFGAIDAALNAYAAASFGARQINWMHAGYGLGATLGPLLVTVLLAGGASWRFALGCMAAVIGGITLLLTVRRDAFRVAPGGPARGQHGPDGRDAGQEPAGGSARDRGGGHAGQQHDAERADRLVEAEPHRRPQHAQGGPGQRDAQVGKTGENERGHGGEALPGRVLRSRAARGDWD